MITQILFVLVVLAAAGIIALVLMQQSKGDAGAAFGGGGSQSMFGSRGSANFLSRTTSILVTVFFAGSLALAFSYTKQNSGTRSVTEDSVLNTTAPATPQDIPALPEEAQSAIDQANESDVPAVPSDIAPVEVPEIPAEK